MQLHTGARDGDGSTSYRPSPLIPANRGDTPREQSPAAGANRIIPIAGAGPAGLTAALSLAKHGRACELYECRADVGERFHGDYQGLDNWSTAGDVLEELHAFGIEPDFDTMPVHEMTLYDPWSRPHRCRSNKPLFYLIRRGAQPGTLDHALKQQVLGQGIPIHFKQSVELTDRGIVAHGPRRGNVIAIGYVFKTDMADGVFAAVGDRLAPKGYAYLLIHRGLGTVAVCLFDDFSGRNLYLERTVDFFSRYVGLRMHSPQRFGGVGDTAGGPRLTRAGHCLHVGEAAGFQDALFGFGIRYAMTSGHLAAQAIGIGDAGVYDRLWKSRLGGYLRTARFNRFLYARGGCLGYAYLINRVCKTRDPREWLRRFYAPSPLKSLCFRLG